MALSSIMMREQIPKQLLSTDTHVCVCVCVHACVRACLYVYIYIYI